MLLSIASASPMSSRKFDKVFYMGKAVFTLKPCCKLMANIGARMVWKAPRKQVDRSVEVSGDVRLGESLTSRRLHQAVDRQNSRLSGPIDEGCPQKLFDGVSKTAQDV